MVKRLLNLFIVLTCSMVSATALKADDNKLYLVGNWQGWDPSNATQFDKEEDGTYKLSVDFSTSQEFKISTERPAATASTEEKWQIFDSGAYCLSGNTELNATLHLTKGASNIKAPDAKTLDVIVDLKAMTIVMTDGGEIAPPVVETQWSGTLPVLFINTENNEPITSKDAYLTATYYLDAMDIEGYESIGTEEEPLVTQIKGRGNYTWIGFDKKPYRLKLEKKQALMGMEKSKHFVLLANADDYRGFLRNTLGFWFSKEIEMAWTPAQKPIELVINGEYLGLYFLTENIRVDKDRVNIVEQPDLATDPEVITGGWLVEIDNYDTDPHVTVLSGDNEDIWFTYKSPEELSTEQEQYLYNEMKQIDDLLYGDKNSDELWNHLDIDTAAKFYIVQEIMDNTESYHGSCYLYKQQGDDAKWCFGPVWDFGSSLNNSKDQFIYNARPWRQVWIGEMVKFPTFMNRVKELWKDFAGEKFDAVYDYIDSFASEISEAAKCDAKRWPKYGNANEMQKAKEVSGWMEGCQTWLSEQWGAPESTAITVNFVCNNDNPWNFAFCYVFDGSAVGFDGNYLPLGDWPGQQMQQTEIDHQPAFTLSFTPSYPLSRNAHVIFNNGGSGQGNQTEDLVLVNGKTYYFDNSGIKTVQTKGQTIYTHGNTLYIASDRAQEVMLSDISGRTQMLRLQPGVNTFTLPHGFYIVNGKKVTM